MGQITSKNSFLSRTNLKDIGTVGIVPAGEHILVSSDNSMTADGQGNFDSYIVGDGTTIASSLPIYNMIENGLLKCSAYIDTEKALANILRKIDEAVVENTENINEVAEDVTTKMSTDEELVIAAALVDLHENGTGSSSSVKGDITINNSDIISILGASFSDGNCPIQGKDWTNILSELTDYNYYNIAYAGSNPAMWMSKRIRNKAVKGKYAMITGWSINQLTTEDACKAAELMADSLESLGIEPIICSPYNGGSANDSFLRDFAKRRNYYYYPCGEYYALTYKGRNHSGDNGYHLGTYSIGVWSNGYMIQAPYIERPMQSLKLFKLREASFSKTLDELVFHTNEERMVNFKELCFGQYGVGNQYSNLPNITFTNAVLATVILPIEAHALTEVVLNLNTVDSVRVYVLNSIAEPYPVGTVYSRFSVENEIAVPTAGDTYSSGGKTYTVLRTIMGENGMYCTIYCSPSVSETGMAGVLEKVSGSGQQTIPYTIVEQSSFGISEIINNDNDGHWEEVFGSNGAYLVSNFSGTVALDKMHFLILHDGDFNISSISVHYEGTDKKIPKRGHHVEFDSNEYNDSEELILEPTFGNVGTVLTSWIDDNGNSVVSSAGYTNNYIFDNSVVILSANNSMKQVISNVSIGKYWLEIMARNPKGTVTQDSYDFADLKTEIGIKDNVGSTDYHLWTVSKKIGLYPTIVRLPIEIGTTKNIQVKLYSEENIEIFKVSFKKI